MSKLTIVHTKDRFLELKFRTVDSALPILSYLKFVSAIFKSRHQKLNISKEVRKIKIKKEKLRNT